jgi:Mlc titration factor MtfA (ptsG expression regulator)
MLVTPEINRQNRNFALTLAGLIALAAILASWFSLFALVLLCFCPLIYWLIRRKYVRRLAAMKRPFPAQWDETLEARVAFFRALTSDQQERFRQLVSVFLDEVRITGIGTEIDDTIRVLVAASAAIPIFGFRDWEYRRLGEVLIYPQSFGEEYQASKREDSNILGMVGVNQLRGVMILSKPSLLAGFESPTNADNVGIHEFAHLVELEAGENGLPAEVAWPAARQWVEYVARELSDPRNPSSVRSYAYTNESEFFAVLAEYFFESPDLLEKKDPELYRMLREMFHQDTVALFRRRYPRRLKYSRKATCPCGSGEKYKRCCLPGSNN